MRFNDDRQPAVWGMRVTTGLPHPDEIKSGELQSPGTGPFFGRQTLAIGKSLAENMDLSPSRQDFADLLEIKYARWTLTSDFIKMGLVRHRVYPPDDSSWKIPLG